MMQEGSVASERGRSVNNSSKEIDDQAMANQDEYGTMKINLPQTNLDMGAPDMQRKFKMRR